MKKIVRFVVIILTLCHLSCFVYAKDRPFIVATFSILADVVKNVGGDLIDVKAIVGPNQDTHIYDPTPEVNALILKADTVIINGFGFETWVERLIEASHYQGLVTIASTGIKPLMMMKPKTSKEAVVDPHVWNDVRNVMVWVKNIKETLQKVDPQNAKVYAHNAQKYLQSLKALDDWIKEHFKGTLGGSCKVITAHDAFKYFERAYGLVFLAPSGLSTQDEPSAFELAALIQQIRREKITTLFVENISNQRLINQISSETGAKIGGVLYSDALSLAGEGAGTYLKMMKHNVEVLVSSLGCKIRQ